MQARVKGDKCKTDIKAENKNIKIYERTMLLSKSTECHSKIYQKIRNKWAAEPVKDQNSSTQNTIIVRYFVLRNDGR